jgi:hypothetical protein
MGVDTVVYAPPAARGGGVTAVADTAAADDDDDDKAENIIHDHLHSPPGCVCYLIHALACHRKDVLGVMDFVKVVSSAF